MYNRSCGIFWTLKLILNLNIYPSWVQISVRVWRRYIVQRDNIGVVVFYVMAEQAPGSPGVKRYSQSSQKNVTSKHKKSHFSSQTGTQQCEHCCCLVAEILTISQNELFQKEFYFCIPKLCNCIKKEPATQELPGGTLERSVIKNFNEEKTLFAILSEYRWKLHWDNPPLSDYGFIKE